MKTSPLLVVGLLAFSFSAQATTLGLSDPLGNPASTADVGYALWDSFADADSGSVLAFSNAAPGSSDTDRFSPLSLSVSMTGGMVTGSGVRIYNGVGADSAAFNLTLDGTVTAGIDTITLQLKFTTPDTATGLTRLTFFTVNLNGLPAASVVQTNSGTGEIAGGNEQGVVTYSWANLNWESGQNISLSITSPASGHVSVDAVRVDASAVPEPSTYVLLALSLCATLFLGKRHRCHSLSSTR